MRRYTPWALFPITVLMAGCAPIVTGIVVASSGGGGSGGGGSPSPTSPSTPAPGLQVGPAGGVAASGKTRIEVPAGALDEDVTFSVSAGSTVASGEFVSVGQPTRFGPAGKTFNAPLTLTLGFDLAALPAGTSIAELLVLKRNDSTGEVSILQPFAVDAAAGTLKVSVASFSTLQPCVRAGVSLSRSSLSASASTLIADGRATVSLSLLLVGPTGRPVPNRRVTLVSSRNGVSIVQPSPSDSNGFATGTLRATTPGPVSVSARVEPSGGVLQQAVQLFASPASTTPPPVILLAPSGLAAVAPIATRVDLTWTDHALNESEYVIERSPGTGAFVRVATIGPNSTSYSDLGVISSETYGYRVSAASVTSSSPPSQVVFVATPDDFGDDPTSATLLSVGVARAGRVALGGDSDWFRVELLANVNHFLTLYSVDDARLDLFTASSAHLAQAGYLDPSLGRRIEFRPQTSGTYYLRVQGGSGAAASYSLLASRVPSPPAQAFVKFFDQAWPLDGDGLVFLIDTSGSMSMQSEPYWDHDDVLVSGRTLRDRLLSEVIRAITSLEPGLLFNVVTYGTCAESLWDARRPASPANRLAAKQWLLSLNDLALSAPVEGAKLAFADIANQTILHCSDGRPNILDCAITRAGTYVEHLNLIWALNTRNVRMHSTWLYAASQGAPDQEAFMLGIAQGGGGQFYSIFTSAPPANPESLQATPKAPYEIELAWTDKASTESGFWIQRREEGSSYFTNVATLPADAETYVDQSTRAGTTYEYRIYAERIGSRSQGLSVSVMTLPSPVPAAAALRVTSASPGHVGLTWNDTSGLEDAYLLQRRLQSELEFRTVATLPANETNTSDLNVTAGESYVYRVLASSSQGNSVSSNLLTVSVPQPPLLEPPLALTLTPTGVYDAQLSWIDASIHETGFLVERSTPPAGFVVVASLPANALSYLDQGLRTDRVYRYRVSSFNAVVAGVSSEVAFQLPTPPLPTAPDPLVAVARSQSQIDLSWGASNHEDELRVERSESGGPFQTLLVLPRDTTSYQDGSGMTDTQYSYRVVATNANGSVTTQAVSLRTLPDPPPTPSGFLGAIVSPGQIDLQWTDVQGETAYELEERVPNTTTYQVLVSLGANTIARTVYVGGGTDHEYRLRAINSGGSSAPTSTVYLDMPHHGVSYAWVGGGVERVSLNWWKRSGADSYRIYRGSSPGVTPQNAAQVVTTTQLSPSLSLAPGKHYFRVQPIMNDGKQSYLSSELIADVVADVSSASTAAVISLSSTQVCDFTIDELRHRLYAVDEASAELIVLDLQNSQELTRIALQGIPRALALSPNGRYLVTTSQHPSIANGGYWQKFDTNTLGLLATHYTTAIGPHDVLVTDNNFVLVSNAASGDAFSRFSTLNGIKAQNFARTSAEEPQVCFSSAGTTEFVALSKVTGHAYRGNERYQPYANKLYAVRASSLGVSQSGPLVLNTDLTRALTNAGDLYVFAAGGPTTPYIGNSVLHAFNQSFVAAAKGPTSEAIYGLTPAGELLRYDLTALSVQTLPGYDGGIHGAPRSVELHPRGDAVIALTTTGILIIVLIP